jgi:hypothetical protein
MQELKPVAELVREKRGDKSIRTAAKEIKISPTTLCKVERGYIPDTATMSAIMAWIDCKLYALPDTHRIVPVELLEELVDITLTHSWYETAEELRAIIETKP